MSSPPFCGLGKENRGIEGRRDGPGDEKGDYNWDIEVKKLYKI